MSVTGDHRLIVCVGPGGVGKTSLAAALAIDAAYAGRRTAVLTIDPAKRLADALGLDGLDDRLRPVLARTPAGGSLDAAMLDTKASYDALVHRITDDTAARARILANRVYQSFSRTLARSHAYVAMERLYDVLARGEHELVVLDTPPTRSALDILDAPGRLLSFLEPRVLAAFVGESSWLREQTSRVALGLFGAIVGRELTDELAGFFEVFFHLRHGFAERAANVTEELRSARTAFVLVTVPETTPLDDAAYLRDGLLERGVPLYAVLFNRAFHAGADGAPLRALSYDPEAALEGVDIDRDRALTAIAAARALRAELLEENERLHAAMRSFAPSARMLRFPILAREPIDLDSLRALLAHGIGV